MRRTRRKRRPSQVAKPNGTLHPRVQQVGPEHFGIGAVDPHKGKSAWMLCDFYGRMLLEPRTVYHRGGELQAMVQQLRTTIAEHQLNDVVVAIERTGQYHLPVKRALAQAGIETRIVHPFASKQHRLPADPGNKTDETDLHAIHRATVNGFGLLEPPWDTRFQQLQMWARHRRDLVRKASRLRCQIREHLDGAMPGYGACFADLWASPAPIAVARRFRHAELIVRAGTEGLSRALKQKGIRFMSATLEEILAWARDAAEASPHAHLCQKLWMKLDDDRRRKVAEIQDVEREMATLLVGTPYVVLLSMPGINVVSAGDLAGEMGPIEHYAYANAITGRAGLYPSRYQSNTVDHPNGRLIRARNRKLRGALMRIADNLIRCNDCFRAKAAVSRKAGKDRRHIHVRAASNFARIAFQMVAGRQVFRHPCCQTRDYVLKKLVVFHRAHGTANKQIIDELAVAATHLPARQLSAETKVLQAILDKQRAATRRNPQSIGNLIGQVLTHLETAGRVQSERSGDQDLVVSADGAE